MKKSTIWRPTEAAALGNVPAPKVLALDFLYDALAASVRLHDRHGAHLVRKQLVRSAAGGEVGER